MSVLVPIDPEALEAEARRKARGQSIAEEAEELAHDLPKFIRAAWHVVEPHEPYVHNFHIDAMTAHLAAVTAGHIRKLQVWVPPGSMKSRAVSILWPAHEWATMPWLRYFGASYDIHLSTNLTVLWRNLVMGPWFQARWQIAFEKADERFIRNTVGGSRLATAPGSSGSGHHGHRLLIDDPLNAKEAEALSAAKLEEVNEWYDGTLPTRFANPKTGVEVIIMQRLHENDLAAHALSHNPGAWTVLCLPERYEGGHPYAWRGERVHPAVKERVPEELAEGDPREENELLWEQRVGEEEHAERLRMGRHRAAGQLQQRPTAREGDILLRSDWRYYPPEWLEAAEEGDPSHFPPFTRIALSWDTAFKDKTQNDPVSGGCYGVIGADRYRLRSFHGNVSLGATMREIVAMRDWAIDLWPNVPINVLIEKSANGVEIIGKMRRTVPGVVPVTASVDKVLRAEAAAPDLESHNVFLPGQATGDFTDYDPAMTPDATQQFVEECAAFPNGAHDDRVDEFSQVINWLRKKSTGHSSAASPVDARIPTPVRIPR